MTGWTWSLVGLGLTLGTGGGLAVFGADLLKMTVPKWEQISQIRCLGPEVSLRQHILHLRLAHRWGLLENCPQPRGWCQLQLWFPLCRNSFSASCRRHRVLRCGRNMSLILIVLDDNGPKVELDEDGIERTIRGAP